MKKIGLWIGFFILFIFITKVFVSSFTSDKSKLTQADWIGRKVVFPDSISFISTSTNSISDYNIINAKYKVLVYIDSTGCTSCQLGLVEWKAFIDRCESSNFDVGFVFVIQSQNDRDLQIRMEIAGFTYPIIFDRHDLFDKINNFTTINGSCTFLLDENFKVILIGSPVSSEENWNLYFDYLTQNA